MATPIYLPGANTTAQWFANAYPGVWQTCDKFIIHTTEGFGWPGFGGGASAPNFTIYPDVPNKKLLVRQHYPLNMSARALVNAPGGVNTNTDGVVQCEMVGTCDPVLARQGAFFWPEAPQWALDQLGAILADLHRLLGIKLIATPRWLPYPQSAGASSVRMSFSEWTNFVGIAGHQHVPENDHGDPGNINIGAVIAAANNILNPGGNDVALTNADAVTVWTGPTWQEYVDENGNGTRENHTPVDMLWLTHAHVARTEAKINALTSALATVLANTDTLEASAAQELATLATLNVDALASAIVAKLGPSGNLDLEAVRQVIREELPTTFVAQPKA